MKLALIGYGNVGKALARLLQEQRKAYPFRVAAIHTARHGTAYNPGGLSQNPAFGPPAASVGEFLDRAAAEVLVELSPLNPVNGEPALSHIRAAFARRMHVVTANKGPIAHAYAALSAEAAQHGVMLRFEAAVMDGTPVFNLVRRTLPGIRILGFTGALNSTTRICIEAMRGGQSLEDGIQQARAMGLDEADASYDIDGWDAAAKTAVVANVLMDARVRPQQVQTRGIRNLTPERLAELRTKGKTVCLVSRARRVNGQVRLRVRAEVLNETDILACLPGSSNLLLLHTDKMGTLGVLSVFPGIEQTAYGVFADLVEIWEAGGAAMEGARKPPAW